MAVTLTPGEETQLLQTIEMFEVITESQPLDCQSLEILKEAYASLGRESDALSTAKRIAHAYVELGQVSSAILEYEGILQHHPEDTEAQKALADLEARASRMGEIPDPIPLSSSAPDTQPSSGGAGQARIADGRQEMERVFVGGKHLSATDFEMYWPAPDLSQNPKQVSEPFVSLIAEKQLLPIEASLRLISENARIAFVPLEKYDVDVDLARGFPREICLRWCLLPFDKMGKSVLVATANPFNKEAERQLASSTRSRLIWYLASPVELLKIIRKIYR